jgi:TolB-like protein
MPSIAASTQEVREQLERVLKSSGFVRNERLSRFLRYVVDGQLERRPEDLKESVIAIEVFGRKPDTNKQDSIVRTEASRLRARLAEYYAEEGRTDPVVIELPKGGYAPCFRQIEAEKPRYRRVSPWLIAGLAAAIAAASLWFSTRRSAPLSIAVLPLENLSTDRASDYFADGLTDELIRDLGNIEGLAPRSRTSSFSFKGKPRNMREVASQLQVEYVLEGSLLRDGKQLRINAQLIRARDDSLLWSGKYDREVTDIFAIQEEISRNIVNTLRLKLGRGRRRYETSTEAYDLYLRGRALESEPRVLATYNRMAGFYEQAIAKDPTFAPAVAGLAATYAERSAADRLDDADPGDELSKARVTAERAIELDPLSAEANEALGTVRAREADWKAAEKSFRRSLELDPNSASANWHFAFFLLLPLGRVDEALEHVRIAENIDPLPPSPSIAGVSFMLFSAGRLDEAAAYCPKPCPRALMLQGKAADAIRIFETQFGGNPSAAGSGELGYAYGRAGRRADAERVAAVQWRPIEQAKVFAGLGDKDRTFEALNRAIPLGPVRIGTALTYPEFSLLRGDPRLKELRRKVGLPE